MLSPSLATKGPHVPLGPKGMLCPRRRTKAPMDTSHVPLSPLCHHPHCGPTGTSPTCPHPLWHWGTALWGVLSPRPRMKGPIGTTPAWHRPPCATVPYGTGMRPYKGHFGPIRVTLALQGSLCFGPRTKGPRVPPPCPRASLGCAHRGRSHSAGTGSAPSPFAAPVVAVSVTPNGVTPPPPPRPPHIAASLCSFPDPSAPSPLSKGRA